MKWTAKQEARLRVLYPSMSNPAIAKKMGRTEASIAGRAQKLRLKKSKEFVNPGRFESGETPWNKGKHWIAGGRSHETRFTKGQQPHNTLPVGSYRFDKSGVLQRKISTAKGANSVRWRGVHELVWIAVNGPVPSKHIVVFKPGMWTNVLEEITIDKVECISWADNMRRNTVHRYPKEIAQLVQLRGALNRKINERAK